MATQWRTDATAIPPPLKRAFSRPSADGLSPPAVTARARGRRWCHPHRLR
ncbi:hypothetical protein STRTUCAR8_01662 [Streptomyces turgidiscabies Car8]|uniref:Uncharacterized protein n=1 Tax=Streptomyces turgidiscabies (strain Car8) TaxID=698760 RepID=L7F4Q2_STRT8|nr:hypothetical protein STRTUCAR8_01662 [Streptomyces turgidiscabies Car8]